MREKLLRILRSPWFIAGVAFLLRVAYLVSRIQVIPADVLASAPFANEVGNIAAAFAQGKGFCCVFRQPTGPTAWVAPVYPLLIASVFKIFGAFTILAFYTVVLLNCLFSSLVCLPLHTIAKRVGGPSVAISAAWLWAFFPSGIIIPYAWIWDTSLSALLAVSLLWLTLELPEISNFRAYAAYGLLWGFALLTNPSLGAVLPFFLAWIFFRHPAAPALKFKLSTAALAVILLCCLPWTLRNYVGFHRLIPIRSNFAYEFWSGNNEIFDPDSRAVNRITRYEQAHLYSVLGENAFFDDKWHKARNFVASHPALYGQLCERRIVSTWLGTESPWQDFRHADAALARFLIFWNAVSLVGMMAGFFRLLRRHSTYFFPLAYLPVIFPIPFYLAHTSLRHRHPADPIVAILMAVAVLGSHIHPKMR